jgi:branched-subunit amino acid aminotransferase/4-amino-4-deoxychorismate lyase
MFCNLNGRFYNSSKPLIGVNNRSFRYGDGCFETIKVVDGQIVLASFHMERLFAAIQLLQFHQPGYFGADYLLGLISELVQKNGHQALARVRLTIFRGDGGIYDALNHTPNFLIQSWPLSPENNLLNENGLRLGVYSQGFKAADGMANLKSNSYLLYAIAALHAKQQHYNDVLVLNHRHTIADATIANLFVVQQNDTIVTPPLSDGGVAGVMRRYLVQQLPKAGYTVLEQSLQPAELSTAKAIFLTNAIYGVKWVGAFGESMYQKGFVQQLHRQSIEPLFKSLAGT